MRKLLDEVSSCRLCAGSLPHEPRPVLVANASARLMIVGQAPGAIVHRTGIAWNDASGKLLREWLQLSDEQFYDVRRVAIMPMGFCYPGKSASGDLPPRKECAPQWHPKILSRLPKIGLTLLIGLHAQRWYLRSSAQTTLTDTVKNFRTFLPRYMPLPHPSPRNRHWFRQHPWFESEVLPALRSQIALLMHD